MYKIVLTSPLTINNCLPCPMSWSLCKQSEYDEFYAQAKHTAKNEILTFTAETSSSIESGEGTEINCMHEDQPIIISIQPQSKHKTRTTLNNICFSPMIFFCCLFRL